MAREIRVFGYHGTSAERAEEYLERGFPLHSLPGDWLGDGVYFWQDAPFRAAEWAREHYADPAVIGAEIVLRDCIDLLDIDWEERLIVAYDIFRRQSGDNHASFPQLLLLQLHHLADQIFVWMIKKVGIGLESRFVQSSLKSFQGIDEDTDVVKSKKVLWTEGCARPFPTRGSHDAKSKP